MKQETKLKLVTRFGKLIGFDSTKLQSPYLRIETKDIIKVRSTKAISRHDLIVVPRADIHKEVASTLLPILLESEYIKVYRSEALEGGYTKFEALITVVKNK